MLHQLGLGQCEVGPSGCVIQAGGQLRGAAGVETSGDCLARQVVLLLVLQPGHVETIPDFICGVHVY